MERCFTCNGLEKKDPDDARLAFDFEPKDLLEAHKRNCFACSTILEGIRRFEDGTWTFAEDISRVYVYALGGKNDSLTAEIYYRADKPKLMLEFFVAGECADPP